MKDKVFVFISATDNRFGLNLDFSDEKIFFIIDPFSIRHHPKAESNDGTGEFA